MSRDLTSVHHIVLSDSDTLGTISASHHAPFFGSARKYSFQLQINYCPLLPPALFASVPFQTYSHQTQVKVQLVRQASIPETLFTLGLIKFVSHCLLTHS